MIKAADWKMVGVTTNYRVGIYGFLGGPTVQKEGVANAGLWDQRLALEWVQKYIPFVGGDKDQVTAMGISAGAGSILHHLIAKGGTLDPLYTRAIVQSPGYAAVQDVAGEVEEKFKLIEENAKCKGKGLECLRALSEPDMKKVMEFGNSFQKGGHSGWDPIPDDQLIYKTPAVEISNG
jgi:carboxylesterase type B